MKSTDMRVEKKKDFTMKTIMKKISIFLLSGLWFLLSCSGQNNQKQESGKNIRQYSDPKTILYSVNRKLENVDWSHYVKTYPEMDYKQPIGGIQTGILFANWSVATLVKDQERAEKISEKIMRFTKEVNIEDDAVLLNIKEKIEYIGENLDKENRSTKRTVQTEIREIKEILKRNFTQNNDDIMLKQLAFGTWIEFVCIVTSALDDHYDAHASTVLNRAAEIAVYVEDFEDDPAMDRYAVFLKEIKSYFDLEQKESLSQEKLKELKTQLKNFKKELI